VDVPILEMAKGNEKKGPVSLDLKDERGSILEKDVFLPLYIFSWRFLHGSRNLIFLPHPSIYLLADTIIFSRKQLSILAVLRRFLGKTMFGNRILKRECPKKSWPESCNHV